MRVGVLADVHGNLHALEAVVERLETERPGAWVCAGDLVGYGPFPNECVASVHELGAVAVAGNHDLMALGRLPDDGVPVLARETIAFTRAVLEEDARGRLAALPLVAPAHDAVLVAHGSLRDPCEYVTDARQARSVLREVSTDDAHLRVVVLGHTHRPMAVALTQRLAPDRAGVVALPAGEPTLLNPGSVGQSRERHPLARGLLLDLDAGTATFHAVAYDVAGCRRALRAAGLPEEAVHLRPSALAMARSRLGGTLRRQVRYAAV